VAKNDPLEKKPVILFLYLKTGGGHMAPAKALTDWINGNASDRARAVIENGVSDNNFIAELLLEQGYKIVTTRFPFIWKPFYDLSQPRSMLFANSIGITLASLFNLAKVIIRNKPVTVVTCHFLLNVPLKVLRRLFGLKFKLLTLCTDPFTIHPFWFYKQYGKVLLFSEIARDEIMASYRIAPERLPVFPWVMQSKFSKPIAVAEIPAVKERLGFTPGKNLVLISGGGEGLPRTEKYFSALLESKADFELAVVCGKNKRIKRHCAAINRKKGRGRKVIIYGFTPHMYELVNACDIVVSKAGTSTVMETLVMEKPLLIAQYLYGQEFGNAMFVVRKSLGAYLPKPGALRTFVEKLISEPAAYQRIVSKIRKAKITNGAAKVSEYILDQSGV
jgi:UDP-N-acetylglucosamine:LPS N-acetylglucosamine transferase